MEKPWKLRELKNYKVEKLKRNRRNGQKILPFPYL
jgi:hypothetical protein